MEMEQKFVNLSEQKGLHHDYLSQLRDKKVQNHSELFRHNLRRLGSLMAQEAAKGLAYSPVSIETPLGTAQQQSLQDKIVLGTVMRAGIPFFEGCLDAMPFAETAFVGAFRNEASADVVEISAGYKAHPSLEGKTLILCDPMLATGSSAIKAYELLSQPAQAQKFVFLSVVAAPEGVKALQKSFPEQDLSIYTAALDSHLNDKYYIVPGLGDAGDLAYGPKI